MLPSALFENLTSQYQASPVPFAIADEQLRIVWHNQTARDKYPSLIMGRGLEPVRLTIGAEKLEEKLHAGEVFHTSCLQEPLFRYAVTIIPLMEGTVFTGAMVTASDAKSGTEDVGSEHLSAVFSQQTREPLFSIFSSLQLMHDTAKKNKKESAKMQKSIQQINQQCYHLLRFTLNFTEIIRLENGTPEREPKHTELCSMLKQLCSALYLTALDKDIRFSFQLPEGPLYLLCDTERLIYAILLLMANSFQFAPGGEIRLTVTAGQKGLHVIISDNGCGISAENLPRIYDLCYSYDPINNCPAGPGLGLTLLRQMILASGGTLVITSEGPGKGTTAAFDLPYEEDPAIPLFHMDPIQDHFNDRFSLFHILMSGVTDAPEIE